MWPSWKRKRLDAVGSSQSTATGSESQSSWFTASQSSWQSWTKEEVDEDFQCTSQQPSWPEEELDQLDEESWQPNWPKEELDEESWQSSWPKEEHVEDSATGSWPDQEELPEETQAATHGLKGVRKKDETADSLIARIRSGELETIAHGMRRDIGIDTIEWRRMRPKYALVIFLGRYTCQGEPRFWYEYTGGVNEWYVATLVTPAFFGRRFSGFWKQGKREAEENACKTFKHDGQVNEVREKLPPSMLKIKRWASLSRLQKDQLKEKGYNPADVHGDMCKSIYSGFKKLGCRTALWDGNVSEY